MPQQEITSPKVTYKNNLTLFSAQLNEEKSAFKSPMNINSALKEGSLRKTPVNGEN